MIRRLRCRFILINLLLVGLVLTVGLALLLAANARRLENESMVALHTILSWQDGESIPRFEIGAPPLEQGEDDTDRNASLVPVFSVTVKEGQVVSINNGDQVDVSEATAAQAAEEALATGQDSGLLPSLGLRFLMEKTPEGTIRIAFADRTWERSSMATLFLSCLLKIPFAILVSVIVGVTNIIPFFGPIVGAVPCLMILLIVEPFSALRFFVLIVALQQFDGNILGPKILGDSTGLSPLLVLVAIVAGGGLFGFLGMVLGVPTCAVLYSILRDVTALKLRQRGVDEKGNPLLPASEDKEQ